ncbi:hypothetical protein M422DRAFT_29582 [Sphaerobolus stellatus SS14]|uniref:Protein ROT1 n=1 Tax=Sphaerobolus stellatus (strain SS14) TaxID=990650 RepID=A0A0C9W3Z2_SPHS4|nr:hypothetical protein M422DRAFT_29582 [Sphaerobolus stellatus SS14]
MFIHPLVLSLMVAAVPALAQINLQDGIHNVTSIEGTWSTGSGAVMTGAGSVNPTDMSFNYPNNTGRSFSFTDAGNWEQYDYRMASNATRPDCITAVLTWQHGTFEFLPNGSLALTPFEGDGFQQVQDRCAAVSNQISRYSQSILFSQWRIFALPGLNEANAVHLNLYEFDGTPVAPMNLVASPPNMLPTSTIVVTATSTAVKRDLNARSSASKSLPLMFGSVIALAGLGAMLVLL